MMRYLLPAVMSLAAVLASAQVPAEPYPGQREHRAPPEGWNCSRDAADFAHVCFCTGMVEDPECPTPPIGGTGENGEDMMPQRPPEDPKCTVYCHRGHCTCVVKCHDS